MSRYEAALQKYGTDITLRLLSDDTFIDTLSNKEDKDQEFIGHVKTLSKDSAFKDRLEQEKPTEQDAQKIALIFDWFAQETAPNAAAKNNWKFLDWTCKSYIHSHEDDNSIYPIYAEDLYKIKDDLKDFQAFSAKLDKDKRDITKFTALDDLRETIRPHQQQRDQKKIEKEARRMAPEKLSRIMESTSVIYDGEEGKVVIPYTAEASIFWGQQTRWCTAAEKSNNYFDRYNRDEPLWIFIPKVSIKEREINANYVSFKYTGTKNRLYDEHDNDPRYLPPYLERLIKVAEQTATNERKRLLKRHGGYKKYKPIVPPDPAELENPKTMRKAVLDNEAALKYLPDSLKGDKNFVLSVIDKVPGIVKTMADDLKADKDVMLAAVKKEGELLQYASAELRADIDVVTQAIKSHPPALKYADDKFKADRDIVLMAVSQHSDAYQYATPELKHDKAVIVATFNSPKGYSKPSFRDIPVGVLNDKELALLFVKDDSYSFDKLPEDLKSDPDIVLAAVIKSSYNFEQVSLKLKTDKDFAMRAVQNGVSICLFYQNIRNDAEIVLAAVQQKGHQLEHASDDLKGNRDIVMAALKRDGLSLEFAAEKFRNDPHIVSAAVSQNGEALQFASARLKRDRSMVMKAATNAREALLHAPIEYRLDRTFKTKIALRRSWHNAVSGVARHCKTAATHAKSFLIKEPEEQQFTLD